MNFSSELLFFFSALGVFNALLISVYFIFIKRPAERSNYFFGFLLLMLAVRVGKSVVYYNYPDLAETFIKIGLGACMLIGPLLYFYALSVVEPDKKKKSWPFHIGGLLIIQVAMAVIFEKHDPQYNGTHWVTIIYCIWIGYILATAYTLRSKIAGLFTSDVKTSGLDFWLLSVWMGNLLTWIAYKTVSFTSYIVGALSFSFILYLLILLIFFNRKKKAIFNPQEKYGNKKIAPSEAAEWLSQLSEMMDSEKLYKDPSLKLPDVAQKLNILPHTLSQLLNENLDKNFTNYINQYRVEEAKSMILTDENLTLEAIGYECGFYSKSTFYTAFKKFTKTTPSKYKDQG